MKFTYNGKSFDLDLYTDETWLWDNRNKGMVILECELSDPDEKVELPPFIKVFEEVTGNPNFSNYNLALKPKHQ